MSDDTWMTDDIFSSFMIDLSLGHLPFSQNMMPERSNNNDQYFRNIRLENIRGMFPSASTNYCEKEKLKDVSFHQSMNTWSEIRSTKSSLAIRGKIKNFLEQDSLEENDIYFFFQCERKKFDCCYSHC